MRTFEAHLLQALGVDPMKVKYGDLQLNFIGGGAVEVRWGGFMYLTGDQLREAMNHANETLTEELGG